MRTVKNFLVLVLMVPAVLWAAPPQESSGAQAAVLEEEKAAAIPEVKTYEALRRAISQARARSRVRVEKAVEQERVREAWEIGRLIDAHVLRHKERADYGENVLERLSGDLGMSRTELSYMLQFARAYPILRTSEELTWGHYESLLALNDAREREEVEALAAKEKWPVQKLREEVKKRKAAKNNTQVLEKETKLTAKPGKLGTYKFVKATAGPETGKGVIDLGFSNYYKTSGDLRFKEGAIIEVMFAVPEAGSSPSDRIKLSKRTSEDLYTYRAWVTRVLDGDTIEAVIDLGFGVRSVQTLRLRGIDAPELVTADGMESKKAMEKMLNMAGSVEGIGDRKSDAKQKAPVLVKTVRFDKYDRYLADVFVNGEYVNQKLIEGGFAVQVEE